MTSFAPFTLSLFQGEQPLDAQLLTAARLHVGAAGIEQTAALERLIAAGQQHTGLVQAVQRVHALLELAGDSEEQQRLLQGSQLLLLVLEELSAVVTGALQQITATPVQSISALQLDDIAGRMQRHLSALETLIAAAEESPVIPEDSTPALEAVLADLRVRIAQIAAEQRQGHLMTLSQLITQAASNLAHYEGVSRADRVMELKTVLFELQQHLVALGGAQQKS
jgi:hypothetical protein